MPHLRAEVPPRQSHDSLEVESATNEKPQRVYHQNQIDLTGQFLGVQNVILRFKLYHLFALQSVPP